MRLTLMRHAHAECGDPQIHDFDRPLNRRGSAAALAMSRRLAQLELVPALMIASTAERAQQTARIVARELAVVPRLLRSDESLYLAPAPDILRIAQSLGPRVPHLMVIGHNPGISELAQLLANAREDEQLQPGAVCSLTFDARSWADVGVGTFRAVLNEVPPVRLSALWA